MLRSSFLSTDPCTYFKGKIGSSYHTQFGDCSEPFSQKMQNKRWAWLRIRYLWFLLFVAIVILLIISSDYPPYSQLTQYIYTGKNYPVYDYTITHEFSSPLAPSDRPWYYYGGQKYPTQAEDSQKGRRLWPNEAPDEERIENQLMFVPPSPKPKKILFYFGPPYWANGLSNGSELFKAQKCPVNSCVTTNNTGEAHIADAIVFHRYFKHPGDVRHSRQVWIWSMAESPLHTDPFMHKDVINWTMTYRGDSDVPLLYTGLWKYYNPNVTQKDVDRNYAAGKTNNVAWFVSNCQAKNNRLEYAEELSKYIDVDIYGSCGKKTCPRFNSEARCREMLQKHYRFYLAFENSNCREYITEKILDTALGHDVLPIVMGAHPDDYTRRCPNNSFIHVDNFKSPKELAAYLLKLSQDDDLYNSYFRWKGTGEFVKTPVACQLCAMLHDNYPEKSYHDINEWWWRKDVCRKGPWTDTRQFF